MTPTVQAFRARAAELEAEAAERLLAPGIDATAGLEAAVLKLAAGVYAVGAAMLLELGERRVEISGPPVADLGGTLARLAATHSRPADRGSSESPQAPEGKAEE